jgi:hypothetical protein
MILQAILPSAYAESLNFFVKNVAISIQKCACFYRKNGRLVYRAGVPPDIGKTDYIPSFLTFC